MLRGYADAHVVLALIQALRQRGMDVVRVQDRGREQADDADLLDEALADERVMLTNDTDFLVLAAERGTRQERFAPIFFWPQQRPARLRITQRAAPVVLPAPVRGRTRLPGRGLVF